MSLPDNVFMIHQWTGSPEILNVKPNGNFELGNGVDPLVALGQLAKAFMLQQQRIKRLEEAGDVLAQRSAQLGLLPMAIEGWHKAKEAKP